jgi:hypothetical protein
MALLTATLQVDLISAELNRFPGRRLLILVGHGLAILSHVGCVPSSHSDQSGVFSRLGLPSPSRPRMKHFTSLLYRTHHEMECFLATTEGWEASNMLVVLGNDPRIQALSGPKVTRPINPNVVRLHKAPVVANKRSIS